jgi:hypothetical protein
MKNSKPDRMREIAISRVQLARTAHPLQLFGVWQQRGPETLSGYVGGKLRLTLEPPQSVAGASAAR